MYPESSTQKVEMYKLNPIFNDVKYQKATIIICSQLTKDQKRLHFIIRATFHLINIEYQKLLRY